MISKRNLIHGLGFVVQSDGNLSTNVQDLGGRLISVRDEAFTRVHTAGKECIGQSEGTRVSVEFDYISGQPPVAIKYSQLSPSLARRTVVANTANRYHCTGSTARYNQHRKTAESQEKRSVPYEKRTAVVIPRGNFDMSPAENSGLFNFFLGDMAKAEGIDSYIVLNKGVPITVYPISKDIVDGKRDRHLLENPNGTIIVPYGWFRSLDVRSELSASSRGAEVANLRARGVLDQSAEGASQKSSSANLLYNKTDVTREIKRIQRMRAGKVGIPQIDSELEQSLSFLLEKVFPSLK